MSAGLETALVIALASVFYGGFIVLVEWISRGEDDQAR